MEHKDQYWDSKCNHTPTEVLGIIAQCIVCYILRNAFSVMNFISRNKTLPAFIVSATLQKALLARF